MKYPDEIKGDKLSKEVRKGMGFRKLIIPKKRCGNCKQSYCHNPGAYCPGLSCKLMKRRLKIVYPYDDTVVDPLECCNEWKEKK